MVLFLVISLTLHTIQVLVIMNIAITYGTVSMQTELCCRSLLGGGVNTCSILMRPGSVCSALPVLSSSYAYSESFSTTSCPPLRSVRSSGTYGLTPLYVRKDLHLYMYVRTYTSICTYGHLLRSLGTYEHLVRRTPLYVRTDTW